MTRRIVITGAGTGIGLACARRFLAESPELHLIGRRRAVLEDAAGTLRAEAPEVSVASHVGDLSDPERVGELAGYISDRGAIDVLVLNAGGNAYTRADDSPAELAKEWEANFAGNVLTTVLLGEALLPAMARPGGRVIVMSSAAATRGSGAYGAAKAAVNSWVMSSSAVVAPEGVTVNAVAPGFIPDTGFWTGILDEDPEVVATTSEQIPMRRPGTPAEVAEAVAYLASPDAGWTTAQIVGVNGGAVTGR